MQTSHEISSVVADDEHMKSSEVVNSAKESANEVKNSEKNKSRSDLSLNIPTRRVHFVTPGISPSGRTSPWEFFRSLSFKLRSPVSARTYSEQKKPQIREVKPSVTRSLSVPLRNIVIVRSVTFAARKDNDQIDSVDDQTSRVQVEDDEEIDEEEAVCRICLVAFDEGNQFKMECSCKGALKLVHEECAVKWFTVKGNKNCDVCGREVSNLPVTLFRMRSYVQRQNITAHNQQGLDSRTISAWQDIVRLVLISTICYFFLIEQLLVDELKTQAVVIAAPFSFTFGILSSTFAVILDSKFGSWTTLMNKFRFSGIYSNKQSFNPGFYNWNRVIMRYCDGASFTGDVEKVDPATNLHYRGVRIFNVIMEELLAKGLNKASNALLTGCSSGGLAAILYCDKFRAKLPATSRVKCVPDAGYFVHVKDISGKYYFQKFFAKIVKLHNSCFYPQFILPEIKTPVFVINSAYDLYQVQNILAPDEADKFGSWYACKLNVSNCSPTQLKRLYDFRSDFVKTLKSGMGRSRFNSRCSSILVILIAKQDRRATGLEILLISWIKRLLPK
ncbi:hypothetical protein L1987_77269 [Smallanthus sonchifolius]|uniref:Uncharacterized protein n=1 Tax=Smallanthus sonchifolius TaxID=185202 RepID=A0ACB8ZAJ3_9ASTR|nr:hypothetical protein L1987_77269 [Smallanthus sonchifolius]